MAKLLLYLQPDSNVSLQAQIRQKIIEAIQIGSLPAGSRLPSSRELADELAVARNTVVLAYEQLVDEGYLVSRERSGVFVNDKLWQSRIGVSGTVKPTRSQNSWLRHLKNTEQLHVDISQPPDWWRHPYPFIDNCFDDTLYPVAHWREATRLANGARLVQQQLQGHDGNDAPELLELIRAKILPRRGIQAGTDEILLTFSPSQALSLLLELFVNQQSIVAMEDPGPPAVRALLSRRTQQIIFQPVDADGLCVDERIANAQLLYVTPSHQTPTGVTMSTERRHRLLAMLQEKEQLLIEDDSDGEINFLGHPHPALYSLDKTDRVIYLGSLPAVLAPGVALSYLVAAPEVITALRRVRNLLSATPPLMFQHTAAQFIAAGYYDALLLRLHTTFRERWTALRDALNHYLPQSIATIPNQGGTVHWVNVPNEVDVDVLQREAGKRGILLEPVKRFFAAADADRNGLRLSITGIVSARIREGVAELATLIRELSSGHSEKLCDVQAHQLRGTALRQSLTGATLITTTVYGHPCTIELFADGRMQGRAGYDDEDRDVGRWWIQNDCWYRQWQHWSYGEAVGFYIVVQQQTLKWFSLDGNYIDTALLQIACADSITS